MKILHLSDLHIGKNLYGFSLRGKIKISYWIPSAATPPPSARRYKIAGDIYDKPVPSAEL
jgi:DNA repair exonuclease SbcCD nuclease subunit